MNGALMTSASPEWYTPPAIIERVIRALGAIDLDPCAEPGPPFNVPAAEHYTAETDGLGRPWHGRVYMNPPYGRAIGRWVGKLAAEYAAGRVTQAIALLPARTDTRWVGELRAFPRCYIRGRLHFSGHPNGAPFPSMIVGLGVDLGAFADLGDLYQFVGGDFLR